MKFMLMIHQGTTPTPPSKEWDELSEAERGAVYAGYKAINETPGVSPGERLQAPEAAVTVQVKDGATLRTDGPFAETKEAINGYLFFEAADRQLWAARRAGRAAGRRADPCGAHGWCDRGAPDRGAVAGRCAHSGAP